MPTDTPSQIRSVAPARLTPRTAAPLPTLTLLYLIAILIPVFFSVGPVVLSPARILLLLVTVPLLINLLSGKYGRVYGIDILLLAFSGWTIVVMTYHHVASNGVGYIIEFTGSNTLDFLGGYLIARATIRSRQDFEALARVLSLSAVILVPFAVIEALTGRFILNELFNAIPGGRSYPVFTAEQRLGMNRAQTVFQTSIHYGMYSAICFGFAFVVHGSIVGQPGKAFRSVMAGMGSFLSLSSGGFLVFLLQVALLTWRRIMRQFSSPWLVLGIAFVLFFIAVELLSNRSAIMALLTLVTFSNHTAYWRATIFEFGIQNVWNNPVFGLGMGDWSRPAWMFSSSVDNFWLLNAMRFGILGFILVTVPFLTALLRVGLKNFKADEAMNRSRLCWVITMVAISLTLATVHVWGNVFSIVYFIFGSGIWLLTADTDADAGTVTAPGAAPALSERQLPYSRFSTRPTGRATSDTPRRPDQYRR